MTAGVQGIGGDPAGRARTTSCRVFSEISSSALSTNICSGDGNTSGNTCKTGLSGGIGPLSVIANLTKLISQAGRNFSGFAQGARHDILRVLARSAIRTFAGALHRNTSGQARSAIGPVEGVESVATGETLIIRVACRNLSADAGRA